MIQNPSAKGRSMAGAHRATGKLEAVATSPLGGVMVRRHVLDLEAQSLAWALRRIGLRIKAHLRATPGQMPDEDFRETFELYQRGILALLREQRERARLTAKDGAPPITDEEMKAELKRLAIDAIRSMPDTELEQALAERKAKPAPATADEAMAMPFDFGAPDE